MSLPRLLSGEPLPRIPSRPFDEAELEKYFHDLENYLRRLMGRFLPSNIITDELLTHEIDWFVETPSDKYYTLVEYARYRSRLEEITHILGAGTCTFVVTINGTPVTGTGNNAPSTSQGTFVFSGNNIAEIGDRIEIGIASSSGSSDLAFTIKRFRLLTP